MITYHNCLGLASLILASASSIWHRLTSIIIIMRNFLKWPK